MTRIIAGTHGGRRLSTPAGDRTRPTTDRVREAVFSALEAWAGGSLTGLSFLDLYAGSAAMALEAASRGAAPVVAVDLLTGPAPVAFYVPWADPPYAVPTTDLERILGPVWRTGWLAADGLVVLERSSRDPAPRWADGIDAWMRRYGETAIHYAQEDR